MSCGRAASESPAVSVENRSSDLADFVSIGSMVPDTRSVCVLPHASCRALSDDMSAHNRPTWFRIASPTLASAAEPWIGGGLPGPAPSTGAGFALRSSLRLRPQPAHGGRPAFVPRTTGRRQEMTGTAGASNPQVRSPIRVSSLAARSGSRTLSRWREGFEPRWDYAGRPQPGHPPRHPPPSARGRTAAGASGNGRTARHTSPVRSPRKRGRGFPGRRWLSQDPADLLIPGAGDNDRVEVHLARAMMNA